MGHRLPESQAMGIAIVVMAFGGFIVWGLARDPRLRENGPPVMKRLTTPIRRFLARSAMPEAASHTRSR